MPNLPPQILKILRAKSAEGLSLTSIVVELACYTVSIAYSFNLVSRTVLSIGHIHIPKGLRAARLDRRLLGSIP